MTIQGPPTGGEVAVAGDVSSQYVTALMLIGPYLPGGLRLRLTSPLVSRPYVEMTAAVMATFGVAAVTLTDDRVVVVDGRYRATDLTIEPDASSASYPLAVAAVGGGAVTVAGLGDRSLQGDARFVDLLAAMGCEVERRHDSTRVVRDLARPLRGIDVDMADVSDLVPTVAAVALFAETPTRISGVGFIRDKESDRLGDLAGELRAAGGIVEETDDGLLVASLDACPARRQAGDPPRSPAGDGVRRARHGGRRDRGRRPRSRVEELAFVLGRARRTFVMTKSVVAAFDFDGTLTKSDTVIPFLRMVAPRRQAAGRLIRNGHHVVAALARRDRDRVRALATDAAFTGVPNADVVRLAAGYGLAIVEERLRPDTVARLRWHLEQGHSVVIVSASYEPYVVVVAEQLGVHGVVATRLESGSDAICTGRLDGANCRAAEKVRRLELWFADQGLSRDETELWAYGDSEGDRLLLEYADHPVWVGERLDSVAAPA